MSGMAEKNKDSEGYFHDAEPASPSAPGPLHRQLKNRHIAMIRFVHHPPCLRIHPHPPQYRWCHRYRSLPWDRQFPRQRRSFGSSPRLRYNGNHCLFRHGTPRPPILVSTGPPHPFLQISLGEMIAFLPIPGGHIKLAERFVDPAFSFAMGWNYWYNWAIVGSSRPPFPFPPTHSSFH